MDIGSWMSSVDGGVKWGVGKGVKQSHLATPFQIQQVREEERKLSPWDKVCGYQIPWDLERGEWGGEAVYRRLESGIAWIHEVWRRQCGPWGRGFRIGHTQNPVQGSRGGIGRIGRWGA